MRKQLWLAPVACALSLATTPFHSLVAQQVGPGAQSAQTDGNAGTFHTFDSPYEKCDNNIFGQYVTGLDAADTVSGYYLECTNQSFYGFYRLANGAIHRFHPEPLNIQTDLLMPGVTTTAMNADGSIIGGFSQSSGYGETGFIRDRFGIYTEIIYNSLYPYPTAINSSGAVAGYYEDAVGEKGHGFVRESDGNFTFFDAPGDPALGEVTQTQPTSINANGDIVGHAFSKKKSQTYSLGFLRKSNGDMTVIEPAKSKNPTAVGVADDGSVAGYYFKDIAHVNADAFIYDSQGNYTIFSAPYPGTLQTIPTAVNPKGMIVGYYTSDSPNLSTFYRLPDGTFGQFRVPGSYYTYPTAVNAQGDIAGYYYPGTPTDGGDMRLFLWINPNPLTPCANQTGSNGEEPAQ